MTKQTVLIIFGTRPEAIKMAPLVHELQTSAKFEVFTCVTAQHRDLLDQVLEFFEIKPNFDLDIMSENQDLFDVTSSALLGLRDVIRSLEPDVILVHGDTTTTLAASLAAFYEGVPVGHVESGLRTGDLTAPFPEELNRVLTDRISRWHFAPTDETRANLIAEGVSADRVWVTGNTVVDALKKVLSDLELNKEIRGKVEARLSHKLKPNWNSSRIVLITMHRRENFGEGIKSVRRAILTLASAHDNVLFVFPVHPNPRVRNEMVDAFANIENVILIDALGYQEFVWLLNHSHLVLTDSGGLQEEAPILGKPVLLMRESTERPEGVRAGCVALVGTDENLIVNSVSLLLNDSERYSEMANSRNMYGKGDAAVQIVRILEEELR